MLILYFRKSDSATKYVLAIVNRIACLFICPEDKITKFWQRCGQLDLKAGLSLVTLSPGKVYMNYIFLYMLIKLQNCSYTISGDVHILRK